MAAPKEALICCYRSEREARDGSGSKTFLRPGGSTEGKGHPGLLLQDLVKNIDDDFIVFSIT